MAAAIDSRFFAGVEDGGVDDGCVEKLMGSGGKNSITRLAAVFEREGPP